MYRHHIYSAAASDGTEGGSAAPLPPTPVGDNDTTLPSPAASTESNLPPSPAPGGLADIAANHPELPQGFDPAIHQVDAAGKPVLTPTGRFAKKSRSMRNAASASTSKPVAAVVAASVKADNLPVAKQIVNVGINLGVRFFGDEWKPVDKDEAMNVAFAFRDYFDARGVPQMPPEVVLLLAISAYAAPRLNHDNTRKKLQRMFQRVKDWRDSFKRKK